MNGCNSRVVQLESQLAAALARVAHLEQALDGVTNASSTTILGRRLQGSNASSSTHCTRVLHTAANLMELLPSTPTATMNLFDGRCSRRHTSLDSAWKACMAEPDCTGVVRDNGLKCHGRGGPSRGPGSHQYELRGGILQQGVRATTAWACAERLQETEKAGGLDGQLLSPSARQRGLGSSREGFVFIVLGSCPRRALDCVFLREVKQAIAAVRAATQASEKVRPVAVISDRGIAPKRLLEALEPDLVHVIPASSFSTPGVVSHVDDLRVRKLIAYRHAPFERNVFLDGDTHVRSGNVDTLFEALDTFELAAAFECCRIDYSSPRLAYDPGGFMRGWEMQTGVMAYRRAPRVDAFWAEATREYEKRAQFWKHRSSGEQGAATLALARTDVRYLPLPPSFNARPFTMLTYLSVFGVSIYHGKDLWTGKLLSGEPGAPAAIIAERMLRDWDRTRDVLAAQFSLADLKSNASRRFALRGLRRIANIGPKMHRRATDRG